MPTIQEQHSGVMGLNPNVNRKDNPYIPGSDLYVMQGWYLTEAMSITKRQGFQRLNAVQLLDAGDNSAFTGLFEYVPSSGAVPTKIAMTTVGLYAFGTPIANVWNAVSLSELGGARTGTYQNLYDAAMLFDQMYIGGGASTDKNIRYDGTGAHNMGMAAPVAAPTVSAPQAGGGLSAGVYSWVVTFQNSLGKESLPSPVSANVTITGGSGNYTVNLSAIPVSTDPQVNKRLIYRTTAGGQVWLLVHVINDNTTTTYSDGNADATLGIAADFFSNGVPPHFDKIEIYQGIAFMAGDPANKSRVWFSANGNPAAVNSNDFRDLNPNDGDVITGMATFQSTVVVTKNNSIWLASGSDRTTIAFTRQVTKIGSVNNSSLIEIPGQNKLAMLTPNARFAFFDGTGAQIVATQLEPILNTLNAGQLAGAVAAVAPALNQVRWIVPSGTNHNDLIIWYDYELDKWGTTSIAATPGNYCAALHDSASRLQFFLAGVRNAPAGIIGGYVWQGDIGGTDDGASISSEVVDKGHPRYSMSPLGTPMNYPTPENVKMFTHVFFWFKPNPNVTLNVYAYIDDPDGTPIFLGTVNCGNTSGQNHLHFNLLGRRMYIRVVETSTIQGLVLRGWKIHYKDVGRHNAP